MHDQRRSVRYSQNFLRSPALARRLVATATIQADDLVIEIGPGRGVLTRALAERCRLVIAVEKDAELAHTLSSNLDDQRNVAIYEGDFLGLPLPLTTYKIFANIPFNTTAAIISKLTEDVNPPEEASLVLQREAAERFVGGDRSTLAALLIQPWFTTTVVHHFRTNDFVPPPRVDVVLLRFNKRGPPLVTAVERQLYRDFVTHGFTAWQATVRDAYRGVFSARDVRRFQSEGSVDLSLKPSALLFEQWLALFKCFSRTCSIQQRAVVAGAEERLRRQQVGLSKEHRTRMHRTAR